MFSSVKATLVSPHSPSDCEALLRTSTSRRSLLWWLMWPQLPDGTPSPAVGSVAAGRFELTDSGHRGRSYIRKVPATMTGTLAAMPGGGTRIDVAVRRSVVGTFAVPLLCATAIAFTVRDDLASLDWGYRASVLVVLLVLVGGLASFTNIPSLFASESLAADSRRLIGVVRTTLDAVGRPETSP